MLKNNNQQKQPPNPPHNNRPKWLFLTSSYLSIEHSNSTSCKGRDSQTQTYFKADIIKHENGQEEN